MEEKLRKLMKHEGLNSTRLAEMLGIQASGISHIMSGRNKPSYDFIVKLLQRFPQINPDWLLLDKGSMYRDEVKNKTTASAMISQPSAVVSGASTSDTVSEGLFSSSIPLSERDDEDIIPSCIRPVTKSPVSSHVMSGSDSSSSIERIVVFYNDKTFSDYHPE